MTDKCLHCGKELPQTEYMRIWSVLIGEVCKECRLKEISGELPEIQRKEGDDD